MAKSGCTSLRGYAKSIGLSHVAVMNAIKEGKISTAAWDGKWMNSEIADSEFGFISMAQRSYARPMGADYVPPVIAELTKGVDGVEMKSAGAEYVGTWNGGKVPTNIPYAEALRIQMILMAENKRILNEETMKLLVKRSDVDRQLMVAGLEIRKSFERLAMRAVDAVLAAGTRGEALRVLEDEVLKTVNDAVAAIEGALEDDGMDQDFQD